MEKLKNREIGRPSLQSILAEVISELQSSIFTFEFKPNNVLVINTPFITLLDDFVQVYVEPSSSNRENFSVTCGGRVYFGDYGIEPNSDYELADFVSDKFITDLMESSNISFKTINTIEYFERETTLAILPIAVFDMARFIHNIANYNYIKSM